MKFKVYNTQDLIDHLNTVLEIGHEELDEIEIGDLLLQCEIDPQSVHADEVNDNQIREPATFLNFVAELEKAGVLYKNIREQEESQTKLIHSLLDDVYGAFFSFSFSQAQQIRKIVRAMDMENAFASYPKRNLKQKNVEEWLTKWLMAFVLCNATDDYRDDMMTIHSDVMSGLPQGFDHRPFFESAARLAPGNVNEFTTLRGVLASRGKKGFLEKLFGK